MKKINESGRSMVEMLGVLAIVGVLSIAGVSGYTVAMKKQRANELLNEAVKRAVVLSMKIATGQSVENGLGEFGNNTVGSSEFSSPTYTAGAETFKMNLSGVDESVLNQMKAMLGDNGIMAIMENCDASTKVCSATLHFNKDLKRGVAVSDETGESNNQTVDLLDPSICDVSDDYEECCTKLGAVYNVAHNSCCKTKNTQFINNNIGFNDEGCCDELGSGFIYNNRCCDDDDNECKCLASEKTWFNGECCLYVVGSECCEDDTQSSECCTASNGYYLSGACYHNEAYYNCLVNHGTWVSNAMDEEQGEDCPPTGDEACHCQY